MNKIRIFFVSVLFINFFAVSNICGQNSKKQVLNNSELRLQAIYDRNEFRAKRLRANWLPDGSGYTVLEPDNVLQKQVLVRYEMANGNRTVIDSSLKEENLKLENISPDGKRILYYEQGNLHVRDVRSNRTIQITEDGTEDVISNGNAVWSPDGKRIAYVQRDQSNVRLRPTLVPSDPTYPEVKSVRYARVGDTIASLRVGIVDATGGNTRWLSILAPAEGYYLGQVSWAENSDEVLVEKLSRGRDEREFLIADVRTGAINRIYHESDPAWVIASYRKNMGLEWIRDGNAFIVLSEKDGWRHAYIYSRDGVKESLLTPGKFDIIERAKVDEGGGWFYYYASPDNATQKYLYRVRLDGTQEPVRVTPLNQPGTHNYDFSPDCKWAFHTYSNFDTPPVTELVEMPEHRMVHILEDNHELRAKMETLVSHPTEFIQLDIGNNVVMDAWMMKPTDFDPSKKYPLFVYVYGEPHAQTVLDSWGTVHADFHRLIAELGYLVVSIDGRGTPAPKGAAWRRAIFPSLGPLSTEEQAAGVQELGRTRPYVDMSRVGIWGWSGGGSNTLNAMFRKPDVYHVGIAVAPKPQPHLYNAWFQEIFMRTIEENPEGYRQSAPINFAEGLKGNLLIIHGTGETNTHLEITEGLVDRLIELGKQFDYMTYPNRNHGFREGHGTAVHLRMLITRYLIEHLPSGPR
ncbi:MAG TPA: S9 family peptidase [Candidatus Marinimicrobia bacterium]|nr:S9 family peptidase [Candidatus Neomarinimicrobiota bacterium]